MKRLVTVSRIIFLLVFMGLVVSGKMMIWLVLFGLSLLLAPFFGRLYCKVMCPMETVMAPTDWVSKKWGLKVKNVPKWLMSDTLPWVVLCLSVVTMVASKRMMGLNVPILLILLLVSVLMTLFFEAYVFHVKVCPFGLLQSLASKRPLYSKRVAQEQCISCKKCLSVCPTHAIGLKDMTQRAVINESQCLQCSACHEACSLGAVRYTKRTPDAV